MSVVTPRKYLKHRQSIGRVAILKEAYIARGFPTITHHKDMYTSSNVTGTYTDSKYTVADILSSMANGQPATSAVSFN